VKIIMRVRDSKFGMLNISFMCFFISSKGIWRNCSRLPYCCFRGII
jgi:hypothetical protein